MSENLDLPIAEINSTIVATTLAKVMADLEDESYWHQQADHRTQRITRQYGYDYFKLEEGDFSKMPIPSYLQLLGDKVSKALGEPRPDFSNVIVSLYQPGFSLEPHEDTNILMAEDKGYYFDDRVYGVVLQADPQGHLYFVYDETCEIPELDTPHILDVEESPGLCFCLQGKFRQRPYFHGVSQVANQRVSVTFRKVVLSDYPR